MLRLYKAANLQEAHLLMGLLASAGIEVQLLNAHAQGGLGEIPFGEVYPEVWLQAAADFTRARKIIDAYERPGPGSTSQRCRVCGETSPPAFEICWQCGESL